MEKYKDGVTLFYAPNREVWRAWLEEYHATEKAVWLIYYKRETGKPRVSYDEAVEEALCFGWIDSKPNQLDEERSIQYFSPRKPKSNWSRLNKERIARLTTEEKMDPAGIAKVELAKQNGTWDALNGVDALEIPNDLQEALNANPIALEYFMAFARTYKRGILEWILNAKRPETRQQRIEKTVSMAERNLKANFDKE